MVIKYVSSIMWIWFQGESLQILNLILTKLTIRAWKTSSPRVSSASSLSLLSLSLRWRSRNLFFALTSVLVRLERERRHKERSHMGWSSSCSFRSTRVYDIQKERHVLLLIHPYKFWLSELNNFQWFLGFHLRFSISCFTFLIL